MPIEAMPGTITRKPTQNEQEALALVNRSKPRREYKKGLLKLDFKSELSGGEILEVKENPEGIATFVIKRGNEVIVDFSSFLPPGWTFITPSFIKQNPDKRSPWTQIGTWWAHRKKHMIAIGDMRKVEDIFILFHEISHANMSEHLLSKQEINFEKRDFHGVASFNSEDERLAWSNAIKIARKIKENQKVDLFKAFNSKADLMHLIYRSLISHRSLNRLIIGFSSLHSLKDYIASRFFGKDSEDDRFLDGLFDKGRLRRLPKDAGEATKHNL